MSKWNRGSDLFQRGGGLGESILNKAPFNADLYRDLKGERLLAICLLPSALLAAEASKREAGRSRAG